MYSPDSIKILILWTVTPRLVEAFHAAFHFLYPHQFVSPPPESLRMKIVRHGMSRVAQECCDIAWVPHQVRQCKKSGDHTCARPSRAVEPSRSGGHDERPDKVMTTERWGERVKCRMKCFYETRSHGPQDQDLDGIRRIHISRFLTSGIEPFKLPRGS